ncbi:hypothetical protein [Pseudaestuariivita atlantica]|uniref:Uncharacterized protein n=1 Tax=Pseudaestuariivita atlantica TaxID=1317121 RepID=A0A0L1JLQ2_9RHOB|nr:hypothetical protein [Pseudaestuariivita atlantica]KNG92647.1 hypothetical protein ATO11_16665 [Pseudaestuariivita atlantica]
MTLRSTLVCLALLLPALPAAAQELKAADCETFGKITQEAVMARTAGKRPRAATRQISRGLTGDLERFKGAVPLLVDFVYGLPEAQLSADVGATYASACVEQASG